MSIDVWKHATPVGRLASRVGASRGLKLAAAMLSCTLLVAACGSSGKSSSTSTSGGAASAASVSDVTLTIGDQTGVGAQALLTAAGLIDKLPFKAHWADFTSGPPILEAMSSGSVDVGGVGNAPPVVAAAGGGPIEIVAAERNDPSYSALLVPKGSSVKSPSELKGKTIAVPQGSSSNYHLLAVLSKAGVSIKEVTPDYLQPADALAALASGKVEAVDLWQPYVQEAVVKYGAKVIANAEGYGGNNSYVVASKSALEEPAKKQAISDYLKLLNQAYDWAAKHPQEWAKVWGKSTGLSQSIMLTAAKDDVETPVAITSPVIAEEQRVSDAFSSAGLIPQKVDFKEYFTTSFNDTVGG